MADTTQGADGAVEAAGGGAAITDALKRRATQIQDAVIRRGIKILTAQDKAAGRKLPRDALTYIRYVNERFLAAFAQEVRERKYALKGGNAIAVLRANRAKFPSTFESPRETRDIDMRVEGVMGEAEVTALFDRIVRSDGFRLHAGLSFGEPRVRVDEPRDGFLPGAKIECPVFLGPPLVGKSKGLPFKLEITFGALVEGSWTVSPFPTIADLPPVRAAWAGQGAFDVAHVVPEMMFADKLHAIARYGLGNTRLKDLFDLHCLATQYALDTALVRDCLLHVFREFHEEHLLVGSAKDLVGLDPDRFVTPEKTAAWRTDWENWAGVPFGCEGQMPSLDLPEALRAVAAAVDRMALFNPQTLAVGEEARLSRAPVQQLLGWLARGGAAVRAPDLAALRGTLAEALEGGADPAQALRDLAFRPGVLAAPGAVRLAKLYAAARSLEARADTLVCAHGPLMIDPVEVSGLERVATTTRALADVVLEAANGAASASVALGTLARASAALPLRVGSAFPLRGLIAARATLHLASLGSVGEAYRSAAERLAAIGGAVSIERSAAAAREALRLADRAAALLETKGYVRVAEGFCDEDERRLLQAAGNALDAGAKALGSADRALARAAAVQADLANNSLGKEVTPEDATRKACGKLAKEAAQLDGGMDRLRQALTPFEVADLTRPAPDAGASAEGVAAGPRR